MGSARLPVARPDEATLAPTQPRVWLTVGELAAELRVSERTVRRWLASGDDRLEVLQIGGTVRIRVHGV